MRFNGFPLSAIQSAAVIWPPFASAHATAADHSINRRNLRPSAPFSLGPQSGTFQAKKEGLAVNRRFDFGADPFLLVPAAKEDYVRVISVHSFNTFLAAKGDKWRTSTDHLNIFRCQKCHYSDIFRNKFGESSLKRTSSNS
jgi:hypothetical protein